MRAEVIDDVVRAIDAACANYLASGEVDPTPWLDDISNLLLDVAQRHSNDTDPLFSALREKLRADLSATRSPDTAAKFVFLESVRERVDLLEQTDLTGDGSDLGSTFEPYPPRKS